MELMVKVQTFNFLITVLLAFLVNQQHYVKYPQDCDGNLQVSKPWIVGMLGNRFSCKAYGKYMLFATGFLGSDSFFQFSSTCYTHGKGTVLNDFRKRLLRL